MPFIEEVGAKLIASVPGVVDNVTLFYGPEASGPAVTITSPPTITITDTGGMERLRRHDSKSGYQQPSASLLFSGSMRPQEVYALAWAAHELLDGLDNVTLSGTRYVKVRAKQEPTSLPSSDKGEARYVFNIYALKDPS